MKTYKHDTEPMINTRSVFGEERKSTPVQDVTTSSAQINHTPADLHVGGNRISMGGGGGGRGCTHMHTHTYKQKIAYTSLCAAQCTHGHSTHRVSEPPRQAGKEWTRCNWIPRLQCWVYTFNSPFLISQISPIREL